MTTMLDESEWSRRFVTAYEAWFDAHDVVVDDGVRVQARESAASAWGNIGSPDEYCAPEDAVAAWIEALADDV